LEAKVSNRMSDAISALDFGSFRLNLTEKLLFCNGEVVPLTSKAMAILLVLVEHGGRIVEKAELIRHVWPDCFVAENNLSQNVAALRRAFSREVEGNKYIQTIARRGYRFVALMTPVSAGSVRGETRGLEPIRSLAVLPFRCLGPTGDPDFLGLGVADALITKLSAAEHIALQPTASVLRFDADSDSVEAGRALRVEAVLSGHLQRIGGRIRASMQLIGIPAGTVLWADQFDEDAADLLNAQDSLSTQAARALALRYSLEPERRTLARATVHREASLANLKGRYFWNKRTQPGLNTSIDFFRRAIDLDPGYALAYAGLADAYNILGEYAYLAPSQAFPKARAAAQQALEIDPSLAEAHVSIADVRMFYDWNRSAAEQEYRRAIQMRPDYATAHHWYGCFLSFLGRTEEAVAEMEQARELEPLSLIISTAAGLPFYYSGQYRMAARWFEEALGTDGAFPLAHYYLGCALLHLGERQRALAALQKSVELAADDPLFTSALGHAHGIHGDVQKARECLERLRELGTHRYVSPYRIATVYAGNGELDRTFEWLEKAFRERAHHLVYVYVDPAFRALSKDERMIQLVRRIGFAG